MLRITVEIIPYGIEAEKKTLGIMKIVNDGTGNLSSGNYKVSISKRAPKINQTWKQGTVINFPRKTRGPWDLLYRALREILDHRNRKGK